MILDISRERPSLWYAYSVIQRGHAHNDALHLLAVGGPLSLVLYFVFFALLLRSLLRPHQTAEIGYLRWGLVVIFFGGLFQCYFQGDQVLLPFWIIAGLVIRDGDDTKSAADRA
ncbi:MAG: hypothetical protein HY042_03425 [Spirochaetia bacterium]|nr:hypothetical protein [Spirochaetia bacterium]